VKDIRSKDARKEWERLFCKDYIDPVVLKIDETVARSLDAITADDHQSMFNYDVLEPKISFIFVSILIYVFYRS